jgi:hypothetical protein
MSKKISAALVVLSLLAAVPASANTVFGYVCQLSLQPATASQANGFGTEGDLLLSLNSQPDCGGTLIAYLYVFSVGATYSGTNTTYLYRAGELQAIYQALVTSRNKTTQRQVEAAIGTLSYQALLVAFE